MEEVAFDHASAHHRAMRLLVVEDDAAIRHLVDRSLTARGHNVLAATNATEMTALLLDFPDAPDLALLDIMLPGMSGLEFASQIKRQFPKIRLAFMTGWFDSHKVAEAECRGRLLIKPFSLSQLLEVIESGGSSVDRI